MDALNRLAEEHADFVDKLTELEAVLDEMMGTRQASEEDVELLDEAVRFFEEELFPHFEREEKFLLPPLEAKVGLYGSLVNVVAYEHAEVRREVGKIKEGLVLLKAKRLGPHVPEIEELNRHGISLSSSSGTTSAKRRRACSGPRGRSFLSKSSLGSRRTWPAVGPHEVVEFPRPAVAYYAASAVSDRRATSPSKSRLKLAIPEIPMDRMSSSDVQSVKLRPREASRENRAHARRKRRGET